MHFLKLASENTITNNPLHIVWGHGWAQNHTSLQPIAEQLKNLGTHWLLDLPGFGNTEPPTETWGTLEYTNLVLDWIKKNIPNNSAIIWVGHSFGCRIGIRLAATEPQLIKGLCLIAAAGIPKPINLLNLIWKKTKIYTFKFLKHLFNLTNNPKKLAWLKNKFGSTDYRNASPIMRNILVKVINEDLSNLANQINCPTELIYGSNDQETPIIIGNKLHKLIKNSKLHIIPYRDHWSVLNNENYQVVYLLKNFIEKINN